MAKRKDGFYWVKTNWDEKWRIAQFEKSNSRPWSLCGSEDSYTDAEMKEIVGERVGAPHPRKETEDGR